eukprot:GEMP01041000.1.p1 GENE.GEMP01041000.1~~GEMP01041000.1.p1  ORF type:complete len:296 (+),score=43.41 GEMP01041000.1:259-1146(+)
MGQNCVRDVCDRNTSEEGTLNTSVKEEALGWSNNSKDSVIGPKLRLAIEKSQKSAAFVDMEEGVYVGSFDDIGRRTGHGVLQKANTTYQGQFVSGDKHGGGVLHWVDGRRYSGQFRQDRFHGQAVMSWPDGRHYVGQYFDNRKYGEGTFTWTDGRRYQGQWINGKRHGRGWYTNARNEKRLGIWHQDKPVSWCSPDTDDSAWGFSSEGAMLENSPEWLHETFFTRLMQIELSGGGAASKAAHSDPVGMTHTLSAAQVNPRGDVPVMRPPYLAEKARHDPLDTEPVIAVSGDLAEC